VFAAGVDDSQTKTHSQNKMLKILCLHGKQQNKSIFRTKLGRIPPKLKSVATLTIVDGLFDCEPTVAAAVVDSTSPDDDADHDGGQATSQSSVGKTWYHFTADGLVDSASLAQSVTFLEDMWAAEGGFDGILAFSMGGVVATLLASDEHRHRFPGLQFVVCIGVPDIPASVTAAPASVLSISPAIRSLHIAGETDRNVLLASSRALAERFHDPIVQTHPLGHCIPMKAEQVAWITSFVASFRPAQR
jgi:hypothetical protein